MRQKSGPEKQPAEDAIRDIRRATRRHFSAEEKIRIVLEGLRGEESIAELCRREGIASSMYYGWSKEFLEAGKRRLAGDTARAATSHEVKDLRREAQALKEVSTASITRSRKSCEYGFGIPAGLRPANRLNQNLADSGIPLRFDASAGRSRKSRRFGRTSWWSGGDSN